MSTILQGAAVAAALLAAAPFGQAAAPKILSAKQVGKNIVVEYNLPSGYQDVVHIRWSGPGHAEDQQQVAPHRGSQAGHFSYTFKDVRPNARYVFKVQGVITHTFGHDDCTAWAETTVNTKAVTPEYRVTGIVNNTPKSITFDYKLAPQNSWTTLTLAPNQQQVFWNPYSKADAATSPKVTVRFVGKFSPNNDPATTKVLEGHVSHDHTWAVANQYEFHPVGQGSFNLRKIPAK